MTRWMARTATVVMVGMAVAGLSGCGGDVSSNPFIVEKFKSVDEQVAKVKDLPVKVRDLSADMAALRDDIARLKGAGGVTTSPVALAATLRTLGQRLADMETRIQALEVAMRTKVAVAPPKPTALPPIMPPPTGPKPTPIQLRTAAAPTTPTLPGARPGVAPKTAPGVRPPKAADQPVAPSGQYYTAVEGDTVKSVAGKFSISVADLCKANKYLKPDSVLLPGQNYWVPVLKK